MNLDRRCDHSSFRKLQALAPKRLYNHLPGHIHSCRRQTPKFIDQIGKFKLAAARYRMFGRGDNERLVIEKNFGL